MLTKATNSMIRGAPVNVQDWGAVGDDTNDDTAAILAAYAHADLNGGQLVFPPGWYKTTATLLFDKTVDVVGLGSKSGGQVSEKGVVIRPVGDFVAMCCNAPEIKVGNFAIERVSGSGDGLVIANGTRCHFHDIQVGNMNSGGGSDGNGFYIQGSYSGTYIALFTYECAGIGFRIEGNVAATVQEVNANSFVNISARGSGTEGISLVAKSNSNIFIGAKAENNTGGGLRLDDNTASKCISNEIHIYCENNATDIALTAKTERNYIVINAIQGSATSDFIDAGTNNFVLDIAYATSFAIPAVKPRAPQSGAGRSFTAAGGDGYQDGAGGSGGTLFLGGGDGGGSGNNDGGTVSIQGGTKSGTGDNGVVNIQTATAQLTSIGGVTVNSQTAQVLSATGAVDTTSAITHLVTSGSGGNHTLATASEGQIKYIVMKTHVDTATVTPASFANGSFMTFDAVGKSACLLFTNGSWTFMGGTASIT